MIRALTDGQSCVSRRIGTLQRYLVLTALILLASPATAMFPHGEQGGEDAAAPIPVAAKFTATVKDMHTDGERIRVPLDRSVLVETNHPVATLQAVSPEIAVVQSITPRQFMISGAAFGETQVIAWTEDGRQKIFNVTVELDLESLRNALTKVDPQSRVEVTPIHGHIILTGQASSAATAERMAEIALMFMPAGESGSSGSVQNHLQVMGEKQVLLRCTVAEVNRRAVRDLGINGFLAGDDFADMFVVNQLGGINPINIGAAADVNATGTIPFLTGTEGIPLASTSTLSLGFPRVQMQMFLRAMAENSLMRVLAEPNLVAISGESATFLAGGEFPYPVPQGGQSNAITIEFREFGIRLNFTPVVLANQTIRLRVEPEISALDYANSVQIQGSVVPGLTQRRTHTTVEIGNGQTIAIAGLLSEEVRGVVSRIPGIGDVPVLGSLFRSVEYSRSQSELVVLVTPEIVAPLNPDQVPPVPGQDLVDPNDWQLYMLGMIEGEDTAEGAEAGDAPPNALQTAGISSEPTELSLHGPWGESTYKDFR
ncbi:MAG: type II and III secretion system protein family protein [bacterium]|nr:type II and III secretion system protein family protein [bacterium]